MTIQNASRDLSEMLTAIYGEREADAITNLTMEHITGMSRTERIIHKQAVLSPSQRRQWQSCRSQLAKGKPVQYVLKEAWFCGLRFHVNEHVLIPRPETEELVNWAAEQIDFYLNDTSAGSSVRILDAGTGSGCIAIAIKKKFPSCQVWALDISDSALKTAARNSKFLDVAVQFIKADFLRTDQVGKLLPELQVIISNPPYIPISEKSSLPPHVRSYEPSLALYAPGEDPMICYRSLGQLAKDKLIRGGRLLVETHEKWATEVAQIFENLGLSKIEIKNDLYGKERLVSAQKPG